MTKKAKVYEVTWKDIASPQNYWSDDYGTAEIVSYGILLTPDKKKPEELRLAQSICYEDENLGGVMSIPIGCVVKVKRVR